MADGNRLGTYVVTSAGGENVRAFLPPPLPPDPPLDLSPADFDLLERANRALGRLDGLAAVLPDTALFVYMYVRKEAVLSSQIEGTQSSLSDLLAHEISGELGFLSMTWSRSAATSRPSTMAWTA